MKSSTWDIIYEAKENSILLELPTPPSVNECFAWYPKRHKSDKYKQWISLAEIEMLKQTRYKLSWDEWLRIDLNYFLPLYYKNWNHKKQDLDNLFKSLLDFLWDNIEWFEDRNIKQLNAEKHNSELNIVKIRITEIG